ncbi:MAG: N-acetylglucosamine-6-phosphate deacetylase [Lachnospiraceae bacterium]|nr:N-acetylglucosamine-6-phosphate deacetylase [Lachnospiraceae bacterium]
MIIKNGLVFSEDKTFVKQDIYIRNHHFVEKSAFSEESPDVIDAQGMYVIPGLIDIHSHGAVGCDFSDADVEGIAEILRYEKKCGITSYCPTTMTLSGEQIFAVLDVANQLRFEEDMARIVGINMEGPFLDPLKKGAHMEQYIQEPDVAFFRECNERSGRRIRLVTLAPNMPGALEFIRELKDETTIALGHTSADYDTAREAFAAGARHVTHLYNAMPVFAHRAPGLIGAAAENKECMAELICDGIHVHESVVRATFDMFQDRVVLVSDSMRAAGMADGSYELGGQEVHVKGKYATLSDGTIAGSVTNLFDCMRTAAAFGIPLEEAVAAATMNPAKSIGIYDKVGSISAGKRADVLLLDKELRLLRVIT